MRGHIEEKREDDKNESTDELGFGFLQERSNEQESDNDHDDHWKDQIHLKKPKEIDTEKGPSLAVSKCAYSGIHLLRNKLKCGDRDVTLMVDSFLQKCFLC